MCGEPMAPAQSTVSRARGKTLGHAVMLHFDAGDRTVFDQEPADMGLVRTVRLPRLTAGRRNALAVFHLIPERWLTSK